MLLATSCSQPTYQPTNRIAATDISKKTATAIEIISQQTDTGLAWSRLYHDNHSEDLLLILNEPVIFPGSGDFNTALEVAIQMGRSKDYLEMLVGLGAKPRKEAFFAMDEMLDGLKSVLKPRRIVEFNYDGTVKRSYWRTPSPEAYANATNSIKELKEFSAQMRQDFPEIYSEYVKYKPTFLKR